MLHLPNIGRKTQPVTIHSSKTLKSTKCGWDFKLTWKNYTRHEDNSPTPKLPIDVPLLVYLLTGL